MNRIDLLDSLAFEDPGQMSAQALAYVGDAVYELFIRGLLVSKGVRSSRKLHSAKVKYAKASGQKAALDRIMEMLDENELKVVSRGRNNKSGSVPKNANPSDYAYATAFEALLGYLYLKRDNNRLIEILNKAAGEEYE